MMSLWQCPGFCVSRKSGQEGGRWLHPKGTNIIAILGLGFRKAWLMVGEPSLSSSPPTIESVLSPGRASPGAALKFFTVWRVAAGFEI